MALTEKQLEELARQVYTEEEVKCGYHPINPLRLIKRFLSSLPYDVPCLECGQIPQGQSGIYECPKCGLPLVHDALPASAPSEQEPRFECWSTNEGDSWYEHPADAELLYDVLGDSPKVGDEFEVMAGWCSIPARYRIVSQKDDDFEVECISHPEATAPQPDYKAQRDALLGVLEKSAVAFWKLDNADIHAQEAESAIALVKGGE